MANYEAPIYQVTMTTSFRSAGSCYTNTAANTANIAKPTTNMPLTWAQRIATTAAAAPVVVAKPTVVSDVRFQLHALCERIEVDHRSAKRLEKRGANTREAAANVAAESSMKRKQDAATVPA